MFALVTRVSSVVSSGGDTPANPSPRSAFRSMVGTGRSASVVEVVGEPALRLAKAHALPARVVLDLVSLDAAKPEVLRLGTPKIPSAHGGRRQHRIALGEGHADALRHLEQVEQRALLRVIGACGVSRRRADALVL